MTAQPVSPLQCLGPTDSDWNDKSFRVTERGCVGGRKQPAMLEGADFMQFSDATVSRRHFGIVFEKEVKAPIVRYRVEQNGMLSLKHY